LQSNSVFPEYLKSSFTQEEEVPPPSHPYIAEVKGFPGKNWWGIITSRFYLFFFIISKKAQAF
jgi:hypothetical protein